MSPTHLRLTVWERGAGLTLACGSGACAAIVNAARRGLTERRATVTMPGGDLAMEWRADGHVLMTGPTALAFTGEVDLARIAA
jgi:diaminopimelate epimerase